MPKKKQEIPSKMKAQPIIIKIPVRIMAVPPKRWLNDHALSFAILHVVLSPIKEFILSLGMMLPIPISMNPRIMNKVLFKSMA